MAANFVVAFWLKSKLEAKAQSEIQRKLRKPPGAAAAKLHTKRRRQAICSSKRR